jgi:hypothetical protein
MKFLNNISILFRDGKELPPQGEQWRKLLHQISGIVENFNLFLYNNLTKGRQISSQLTAHSSQLTAHSSQLTAHSSQLTAHNYSYSYMSPKQLSLSLVFSHHKILQTFVLRIYPAIIEKIP